MAIQIYPILFVFSSKYPFALGVCPKYSKANVQKARIDVAALYLA